MNFHISQTKCNLHCPQLMMRKCVQCIVVCFILFINSVHIQVYTPVLIRRRLRSKHLSIGLDISSHQKDIRRTSDDRFCHLSSPPNALQKMLPKTKCSPSKCCPSKCSLKKMLPRKNSCVDRVDDR